MFNGAGTLIDEQLGYEIARYVFGRPAEFRRRAAQDQQMQTAMGLLAQGADPEAAAEPGPSERVRGVGPELGSRQQDDYSPSPVGH